MERNKNELFESMKPSKALAVMAVPTVASQVILLIYNLADTWYIGRVNNPYMIAASSLARIVILAFSCLCVVLFFLFARPFIAAFISDEQTIAQGMAFLKGRCLSLPFMMIGYHIVNYMNAVNQGKVSFLLAVIRHVLLIIPITILMNRLWGLTGLTWAQLVADALNTAIATAIYLRVRGKMREASNSPDECGYSMRVKGEI